MTITLYQDKDWKGRKMAITRDHRSLKDTDLGNSPSSILMDESDDAILAFGREDWKGGVMYLRGVRKMPSLGQLSAGGELFKGNSVTSVRVTPFVLDLNVSVVTRNEKMPGDHEAMANVENTFGKATILANGFFEREKAMIRMEIARLSNRENPEKFNLAGAEGARFPADWKKPGEVDVILCNTIEDAHGMAKFPWWGKVMIVALADRSISQVARTLAHELRPLSRPDPHHRRRPGRRPDNPLRPRAAARRDDAHP